MIMSIFKILAVTAVALFALGGWRWADIKADQANWNDLASHQSRAPDTFDVSTVAGLPDPAQRYFRFAIDPGTPLYTVAEISMKGEFSLGSKADPNYLPMQAEQILAAPHGFIWRVRTGNAVSIAGSDGANDGESWSRFWLMGILPVARAGFNEDHARAAFGRYVAEALFWTPAALLPGDNIRWESVDNSTARVTLTYMGLAQAVDISVDADGRPTKVVFQRWSDANPKKTFQLQPFGGYLSEYQEFSGFHLPTRVVAGNFFETDDYFPFFEATVTSIRFPTSREN